MSPKAASSYAQLDSIPDPRLDRTAEAGDAHVVVLLSHQGSKVDRERARAVPGIDIIVGAHSHDAIFPPERVGET